MKGEKNPYLHLLQKIQETEKNGNKNFLRLLDDSEKKHKEYYYSPGFEHNPLREKEFFLNQIIDNPDKYHGLPECRAYDILDFLTPKEELFHGKLEEFFHNKLKKILLNEKIFPKLPGPAIFDFIKILIKDKMGQMIIDKPERFEYSLDKDLIKDLVLYADTEGVDLFLKNYKKFQDLENKKIHEILFRHHLTTELLIKERELFGIKLDKDFFEKLIVERHIELATKTLEKNKEELKLSKEEIIEILFLISETKIRKRNKQTKTG